MKILSFLVILTLIAPISHGQSNPQVMIIDSSYKPWTNLNLNNDSAYFHFAVIPDRTGAHRSGVFEKGLEKINLMQPGFVVSVGDLIEGYTTDKKEIENEWTEFNGFLEKLSMPFFYVAGNHDYSNQIMADTWQQHFGADYYYFTYKNILFLCLNSEDGATALQHPDFSEEQVAFVKETLEKNLEVDWTMVFMHQPLWITPTAKNWLRVEQLLANRKHTVFTGHTHQYALHSRNNSDFFVLSTMGGVNKLRGKKYGEFDHFLWVTMTPNGPTYANLMLDGIDNKSIQTAEDLKRKTLFDTNPPVRFEPYYYNNKPDKEAEWKVIFNNNTKEDQLYSVELMAGTGLIPDINKISKDLKPGQREEVSLPVQITKQNNWTPIVANIEVKSE
jgi:predicted phosphodiesterase